MKFIRKIAAVALVALCLAAPTSAFADETSEVIRGDVNDDGRFNLADIVAFERWLHGYDIELYNWEAADLCKDGKLNVFDLCVMKQEFVNRVEKPIMTREEFVNILLSKDEFTWSDFSLFNAEDIGSGVYILRYEIEEIDTYLYITGSDMNQKPDSIYLFDERNDEEMDIYEFKYELERFINSLSPPENTEKDRENAQKVADFAFSELEKGNYSLDKYYHTDDDIEDPDILALCEESYFSLFKIINENTFMIEFDRGGFFDVYGYLITDGTIEYNLGWNEDTYGIFDGNVEIQGIYDNIYYFYCN